MKDTHRVTALEPIYLLSRFVEMATFLACNASEKLPILNQCRVRMPQTFSLLSVFLAVLVERGSQGKNIVALITVIINIGYEYFCFEIFFPTFFFYNFFPIFAYRVCDEKLKGVFFQVFFSLRAYHFRSYVIVVAVHVPFIIFITTPLYL